MLPGQLGKSLVLIALAASAGAQATVISASAGQSLIFNFAAPVGNAVRMNVDYVSNTGSPTGKTSFFDYANLGSPNGSPWLTTSPAAALENLPSLVSSDAPLMDGFSILIEVTSGVFTAGRDGKDTLQVIYEINNGQGQPRTFEVVAATLGTDSRVTTPPATPPTTPSVPEPSSLLLAGLACVALIGTRGR